MRGGTENVPLIVGLGKAAVLAQENLPDFVARVRPLRDMLERRILETLPNTELNGHPSLRLANTSNITFHGIESEALLLLLDKEGICASSGSACLADSDEPSHVVRAMKPVAGASRHMIRFSLGNETTTPHLQIALLAVQKAVKSLQS